MSDFMHEQDEHALSAAREVLRTDPEARPPAALEARVRAAFRDVHAAHDDRAAQRSRRWWQRPVARAAAVLLATAAAAWFAGIGVRDPSTLSRPGPAEGTQAAAAVARAREPRSGAAEAGGATAPPATPAPSQPLAATTPPIEQRLASAPPSFTAGEGLAPDADDEVEEFQPLAWLPDDQAGPEHLIEVDVPASAVLDFGLADAAGDEDTVRAAVLVSEDGRPRAIQFLERAPSARPVGTSPTQSLERRRMQP